jgi:hypothetical protein
MLISASTTIQVLTASSFPRILPANPARTRFIVGGIAGVANSWLWYNAAEVVLGGITFSSTKLQIEITPNEWGERVKGEWYLGSGFAPATTYWTLEIFDTKAFEEYNNATGQQRIDSANDDNSGGSSSAERSENRDHHRHQRKLRLLDFLRKQYRRK